MKPIKKILIIRFRQIGDSILAVALCSTLKKSFPDAEIHFVLNKNIASLYEGHPDIDKVITFDKNENKPFTAYIKKVWQVTHQNKYDVIIDMRSTIRTLFFSLFSLKTPFRIGRIKGYTRFLLNYRTDTYSNSLTTDMVERNLLLAAPLEKIKPIQYTKEFRLYPVSYTHLDVYKRQHYRNIAKLMNEDRECYEKEIGVLPGFKVYESVANFILIRYPIELKEALQKAFAEQSYKVKFMNEPDINTHLRITLGLSLIHI